MEYRKNEIRAGIFLLAAFAAFAVMVFAVSDLESLFKKRKEIKVIFGMSDGIDKNAQVRFSGIKIGNVTKIRVAPELDDHVELTLSVYSDAVIKDDAKASIKTLGLVGKKYVEIGGGTSGAKPLPPGGTLIGEDALKMEDLTKAGLEVVGKLQHIVQNIDRLLGDPLLVKNLKGSAKNVEEVTNNIKELTASINANKEAVTASLNSMPEIMKKVDTNLTNLKAIMEKTETIMGKTDATLGDNRKQIDATMENVKEISKNVKELTEELKKHPWMLIRKP